MAVGLAAAALLAPAAAAEAATTPCAGESLDQVFADWGDTSWYFLAPDGGFEDGARGWTLTGAASVVDGEEPLGVGAPGGARSLSLPAGASAISPAFCIQPDSRTVRWVQQGTRGSLLAVNVVHVDPDASSPGRMLGAVRAGGSWEPSPTVRIPLAGTGIAGNGSVLVALEFRTLRGAWRLDDLVVDPKMRR
jgi:hypothetical protein